MKEKQRHRNGKKESEVAQLCATLCDPVDCRPPGSPIHGILQARILEWAAIAFSRGIFLTQGSNPGPPHFRQTLYHPSHQGSGKRKGKRQGHINKESQLKTQGPEIYVRA